MTAGASVERFGAADVVVHPKRVDTLHAARHVAQTCESRKCENAFSVVNLDHIVDRFELWRKELPMIQPFYAVKCNSDPVLLRCLAALGAGFDCASREEIDSVLSLGVAPDRIIYANSVKMRTFVAHARQRNLRLMTFDTAEELDKVAEMFPGAALVMRIAVADPTATCPFNVKFGCQPEDVAPRLLRRARALNLDVVGISFHVGSGCNDPAAFRKAIRHAKELFEYGATIGFRLSIVDIGGGFPGASGKKSSFERMAEVIRNAAKDYFDDTDVRFIAEPGRFFADGAFALVTNVIHAAKVPASVITKNESDVDKTGYMYYINDGMFGSFSCILFDRVFPVGTPLIDHDEHASQFVSTIWGPTCDGADMVETNKLLPKLAVGEWMYYENMGAYTFSSASNFNGFDKPKPHYVASETTWNLIRTNQ